MNDLDDGLPCGKAFEHIRPEGTLLEFRAEIARHFEVDVGLEHRPADLAKSLLQRGLVNSFRSAELIENGRETSCQTLKHSMSLPIQPLR